MIFSLLLSFLGNNLSAQVKKEPIRSGYYFVIQVESVKGDTINFKTINIYGVIPNLKKIGNDSLDMSSSKSFMLSNHAFSKGYYSKAKEKMVGEIMILNTTIDKIDFNGIVSFKKPVQSKNLFLKELYEIK